MKSFGRMVWLVLAGMAVACGGSGSGPAGPTPGGPVRPPDIDSACSGVAGLRHAARYAAPHVYRPQRHVDRRRAENLRVPHFGYQRLCDQRDGLCPWPRGRGFANRSRRGRGRHDQFHAGTDLQPSTRMYWRARVTEGGATSAWSATAQFRTKLVGFSRAGELYDPLIHGETLGTRVGSTTFLDRRGLRVDNATSWVRYVLASTLTSGEISVEVEGLHPDNPGGKSRIFSMMDGGSNLYRSKFLFNVQYRGVRGNPDNAVSYKVLMGDSDLKYEPSFSERAAGVRRLNPDTAYLWTATWGSEFRLTVREGGVGGPIIYDRPHDTSGTYNPSPQTVYLGANDAAQESGSYPGAIYRNLWVGNRPRPESLGSALQAP